MSADRYAQAHVFMWDSVRTPSVRVPSLTDMLYQKKQGCQPHAPDASNPTERGLLLQAVSFFKRNGAESLSHSEVYIKSYTHLHGTAQTGSLSSPSKQATSSSCSRPVLARSTRGVPPFSILQIAPAPRPLVTAMPALQPPVTAGGGDAEGRK